MPGGTRLNILAVDTQPSILRMYTKMLSSLGHRIESAPNLNAMADWLQDKAFDVLILDVGLLEPDVEAFLKNNAHANPDMRVIAVSERSSIAAAVRCVSAGCHDYLTKPVSMQTLGASLARSVECEPARPAASPKCAGQQEQIGFVGGSPAMQRVQVLVSNFAPSTAPVLITGESGTGKEVCAAELHRLSSRANGPFVPINCAALPKDLMESELFGHVKGAFTGAASERTGAAQSAHGGTLFLDEIGEMDIGLQAKLLRFLQTGEIKKVGSDKTQTVDVRVVCATNRSLSQQIKSGGFREDLYYRLNVLRVALPSLRERGNDIVELAHYFYDKFVQIEGGTGGGLTTSAIVALVEHDWPGNVRELQNIIRRGVVMSGGGRLDASDLLGLEDYRRVSHPLDNEAPNHLRPVQTSSKRLIDLTRPLTEIEREIVETVIELQGGSLPKAAASLALSPSTLYRKREAWSSDTDPVQPIFAQVKAH